MKVLKKLVSIFLALLLLIPAGAAITGEGLSLNAIKGVVNRQRARGPNRLNPARGHYHSAIERIRAVIFSGPSASGGRVGDAVMSASTGIPASIGDTS